MATRGKRKTIRQQLRRNPNQNPRELASCYGKIRYNKQDKERALENRPHFIKFYRCQFCPYYHIGRRPRK